MPPIEETGPASSPPPVPSRRDFLTQGAALVGATALLGNTALGRAPAPKATRRRLEIGPDEPIRMGLIGCGGMGNAHLGSIMGLHQNGREKVQIVAVSDCSKKKVDAAAAKCAERQMIEVEPHQDYRQLIARDDLHGVLIAAPEHWHSKMAIEAILTGKDVYVEKPMTLRLDDALELKRVVDANDQILQVGTQYVMLPKYEAARKLVADGAIGHPTLAQTSYCRNSTTGEWNYYGIDPEIVPGQDLDWEMWCGPLGVHEWDPKVYARWRRYRAFSTGVIGDLLVHQMTPLVNALDPGWPVRVQASGGHYIDKEMENHDQVFITAQFEKEQTLIVAGSTCNETGVEVLVRGHQANLFLGGNDCVLRPERIFADEIDEQRIECPQIAEHDELRLDWMKCIRTRQAPTSPVLTGAKVMVIVDLATRSLWDGRTYEFDPATLTARAI